MFRKPTNTSGKKTTLSQYGLLDIPNPDDDEEMDLSDDDMDLEAELAAISSGSKKHQRPKPKPAAASMANLDAMIAESLRDVPDDDDEDIGSGDENDPDLLSELHELAVEDSEAPAPTIPSRVSRPAPLPPGEKSSTISLLEQRISNYALAEKSAKEKGESSRARRFTRGLKTLNDLLKQAKAGKAISDADIPPPVSTGQPSAPAPDPSGSSDPQPPPVPPRSAQTPQREEAPSLPEPEEAPPAMPETEPGAAGLDPVKQEGLQFILKRQKEFKAAALSSKHAGDKGLALEYLKVAKQFDLVVSAFKEGQPMDLKELPTPETFATEYRGQQKAEDHVQKSAEAPEPASSSNDASGLITATSVEEALKQRLAVFQEQESKAAEQGNASKQRRMGRIVKQYQDAIKLHSHGKPIPVDELPTPPGFAPLPVPGASTPKPTTSSDSPANPATPAVPSTPSVPSRAQKMAQATRADKQLAFLLVKQKEFKEAAIKAKRNGNIEQAKEFLRAAKGFDAVIEAARCGLAVDLNTLPVPPQDKQKIEKTFDIISADDCQPADPPTSPAVSLDDTDVLTHLQQQLTVQLKLCLTNREHYRHMGNVPETNRFEQLARTVQQDLDLVTVVKSQGQPPPKFHYESKQFSIIQCNTDLNENDLELTIVRGIAYNVPNPKEIDTYARFEFPYPQEAPIVDRTATVKDTNSPVYNAVFTLAINRSARPCQRVFKRHAIKLQVYSKGGWFAKDTPIGAAMVKLQPLESQVTHHEAYPLMDGRRPAGGSIEIKLRVRSPLQQQQFDNSTHRWLCIDT